MGSIEATCDYHHEEHVSAIGKRWSESGTPAMSAGTEGGLHSLVAPAAAQGDLHDPVVIVGMACRLPGGVLSPTDFWKMLVEERTGQCEVPPERFNAAGFFHPEGDRAGVMNTKGGYFLQEDVRQFENSFFGINNLEAIYMDPQQRKLLEVVYECFESAGASAQHVAGSNTGVYIGNFTVDFQTLQARDPESLHRYSATGSGTAILSNRLSYIFDLRGPSFTLDTACSSSIYCLHTAARALMAGECEGAVVAGANLIMGPEQHLGTMKGGVLSPTSTCHTFDASADGYGRAEGVSALYLKKLSAALRDGDPIRAVVRGTAVNANGKTSGITQPSAAGQTEVIRKAYRTAGLNTHETDYVECHGTGTSVGDPIELEGLSRIFSREGRSPLLIGANKTNVGHSEAASGLTAMIKCVVAFENDAIPATVGLKSLNPKLKLDEWNMQIVTKLTSWPSSARRASINSFGYGGANAHVIIESLPHYMASMNTVLPRSTVPKAITATDAVKQYTLPLSASTREALEARVTDLGNWIRNGAGYNFDDICYTLARRRSELAQRGYIIASPATAKTDLTTSSLVTSLKPLTALPIAFIFTGQGAQWAEMGKQLFEQNSVYRATIDTLDRGKEQLPEPPDWTLKNALLAPSAKGRVGDARFSQPLCAAVQIALVNLLRSWGITPRAVAGHSSGEIAAAYAAGLLSEQQAIMVAYYRGLVAGLLKTQGAMMALGGGPDDAIGLIEQLGLQKQLVVACVNSPESVTVSGNSDGIDTLVETASKAGKFARRLQTGGKAYHSYMMGEVADAYERLMDEAWPNLPTADADIGQDTLFFSSVGCDGPTLCTREKTTALRSGYWQRNMCSSVQFSTALGNLVDTGQYHMIEIGPHSALQLPLKQIRTALGKSDEDLPYSSTLLRGKDAAACLKALAGELYLRGSHIDLLAVNEISAKSAQLTVVPDLPPYHWTYSELLWRESRLSKDVRHRPRPRHEILGSEMAAGNNIDRVWRNTVRLNEVPWIGDHKLESSIVFPAAGYIAMAIEALSQMNGLGKAPGVTFTLRHVTMAAALTVYPDEWQQAELYTAVAPARISKGATSNSWFDFTVSSVQGATSVSHCTGSIRVSGKGLYSPPTAVDTRNYEQWDMKTWYTKLAEKGLVFGPNFQSLTFLKTDRARVNPAAVSGTVTLQRMPRSAHGSFEGTYYAVHPVTIDSCFQAAIMGGTAGNVSQLRAHLPVFVDECQITTPAPEQVGGAATIDSVSQSTGFGTKSIDATVRDAAGSAVVNMRGVRLSLYAGPTEEARESASTGRHPCLRVVWKPDITRLATTDKPALEAAITRFLEGKPTLTENPRVGIIAAVLGLAAHKNPRLNVLELGTGCQCKTNSWQALLGKTTEFPRVHRWETSELDKDGQLRISSAPYDIILIPHDEAGAARNWAKETANLPALLAPNGLLISRSSNVKTQELEAAGNAVIDLPSDLILAVGPRSLRKLRARDIHLLENEPSKLSRALDHHLSRSEFVNRVVHVSLDDLEAQELPAKAVVISLLELENPFLPTMTPIEMHRLKRVTNNAAELIWLSGAAILAGASPDLTLANGLSRALMLEQPALRFTMLDVGTTTATANNIEAYRQVCEHVSDVLTMDDVADDKEFVLHDQLLHVSRFVPDNELNELFRKRHAESVETMPLQEASPARLAIQRVGITDSIYFQRLKEPAKAIPAGQVEVDMKAVSLNAKDIYTLSGKVETRKGTAAIEFSGIIRAVAEDVTGLAPGDRVVVLGPNTFSTTERVPAWACQKMLPNESFQTMPTLPVIYGTALYALDDRAHLRAGESILVHSGAGAFGSATIAIALQRGATVYATVSTKKKKEYLVQELGLPRENIFASRDESFVQDVLAATGGRGVDVVVNSLTGDLLHATWQCCASFGRFVEVGKRDIIDAGKLDMRVFLRNVTFTAFDLTELYYHEDQHYRNIWINKFAQALEMYRAGEIKPVPITVFDVSEIAQAYRFFSTRDRVGKVVISLENPGSMIKVANAQNLTTLDPEKSYLLIGCLGGLGRRLSRWMFNRGARHFTFLGRSGCDKPAARDLVDSLEAFGASVRVVRGDVVNRVDIENAVEACEMPVGGVIQAAMGLSEALFSTMTPEAWHMGIQPKWRGTWNLHEALEGRDEQLDFFVLTSSVSGSVGTATESNYCSANGFLDAFARYRRALGKPITSIGLGMISEVGYLHENPEIEALLLRKGIQPLNEAEFLQVLDLSLAHGSGSIDSSAARGFGYDALAASHVLTGLEPQGIRKLLDQGFDVDNGTMQDPRAVHLSASLESPSGEDGAANSGNKSVSAAWAQGLPSALTRAMAGDAASAQSLNEAILILVRKRFSNLLLLGLDKIDSERPITAYGMDSMIAAEFRTWFYSVFKVDIPFLEVLSPTSTLQSLSNMVEQSLAELIGVGLS